MTADEFIVKTEALVLRIIPFSKTSHYVIWLTPRHGRVTTVVKGARRPKSAFLGQYDWFYTCELLFYSRERNGAHIARECYPLKPRTRFRDDWRSFTCASYLCDLISRISSAGDHEPELYGLLDQGLDYLCESTDPMAVVLWFELKLLSVLGFAPKITRCAACAGECDVRSAPVFFSAARGGVICSACERPGEPGSRIPADILAILRRWQNAPTPTVLRNTRWTDNQLLVFRDLIGIFLTYHVDVNLDSRRIAAELTRVDH